MGTEDRLRFRKSLPYHDRDSTLEDSRLLERDLFQSVAEQVAMVQANAGDDGEFRSNDIGTVKSSSQADFYDCKIHLLVREPFECQSGSYFEKGQLQSIERVGPLRQKTIYIFLRYE